MADNREDRVSVAPAAALALLGTTCCALPAALVALGAGGAAASLFSSLPWLVTVSYYKSVTFAATGLALAIAFTQLWRVESCDIADAPRLRRQRRILQAAAGLLGISVFAAYALLPLARWLESG